MFVIPDCAGDTRPRALLSVAGLGFMRALLLTTFFILPKTDRCRPCHEHEKIIHERDGDNEKKGYMHIDV